MTTSPSVNAFCRRALSRLAGALLAALGGLVVGAGCVASPEPPREVATRSAQEPAPRLLVWIVIDQGRGDLIRRLEGHLVEGGLRRFVEGALFSQAHYSHLVTLTAPGHATLATGAWPRTHGIVGNSWWEGGRVVKAVVGEGGTPDASRLRAPTVADTLKATHPDARVVSLSLKDRGALLMAGQGAGQALWLDQRALRFGGPPGALTPSWMEEFNQSGRITRDFKSRWEGILPPDLLTSHAGADNCPAETSLPGLGATFPHVLGEGASPGPSFGAALTHSPAGSELLLDLALAAVRGEGLGRDGSPDLLMISISSVDLVGHLFGQQSVEMLEMAAALDRQVAHFTRAVEGEVGPGQVGWVLSADHGGPWIPDCAPAGSDAGRVPYLSVVLPVEATLQRAFGPHPEGKKWVALFDDPALYLDLPPGVDVDRAVAEVQRTLSEVPGVAGTCDPRAPSGPWAVACERSAPQGRAPTLFLIPREGWVFSEEVYGGKGTTHGTPHSYDSHVLLGFAGPGIQQATHEEKVDPVQVAATVSRWLHIPPPAMSEAEALPVFSGGR